MIKEFKSWNGKHYIFDTEDAHGEVICLEDTLEYVNFAQKLENGELTGTWKVNRILRTHPK